MLYVGVGRVGAKPYDSRTPWYSSFILIPRFQFLNIERGEARNIARILVEDCISN